MRRGGILAELLLALLLVAAGAAGWLLWQKRAGATRPAAAFSDDATERSAWLQSRVRELLSRNGLRETHVLKSFNRERREGPARWLEDTLELRVSSDFRADEFMKDLAPVLKKKGLRVVRDDRGGSVWTLELGEKDRVFERLIFNS